MERTGASARCEGRRERDRSVCSLQGSERETGASAHCEGLRERPERLLTARVERERPKRLLAARVRERDRSLC
ncbi:hypothetical protein CesoFtcFv8_023396 [Champsocephalus esox]|uniref:Uncharacterized protein n=1 Tax=Champsocephalus esox TaxID=159716 RepID=A0AAN8B848_9TELE|nr:hypothetical protein CesoFtcFv8_023396 [Champsocephalus esox]